MEHLAEYILTDYSVISVVKKRIAMTTGLDLQDREDSLMLPEIQDEAGRRWRLRHMLVPERAVRA